jgi:hypothetical protein
LILSECGDRSGQQRGAGECDEDSMKLHKSGDSLPKSVSLERSRGRRNPRSLPRLSGVASLPHRERSLGL